MSIERIVMAFAGFMIMLTLALGIPGSPGIPKAFAAQTLSLPYNDIEAFTAAMAEHGAGEPADLPGGREQGLLLGVVGQRPDVTILDDRDQPRRYPNTAGSVGDVLPAWLSGAFAAAIAAAVLTSVNSVLVFPLISSILRSLVIEHSPTSSPFRHHPPSGRVGRVSGRGGPSPGLTASLSRRESDE